MSATPPPGGGEPVASSACRFTPAAPSIKHIRNNNREWRISAMDHSGGLAASYVSGAATTPLLGMAIGTPMQQALRGRPAG